MKMKRRRVTALLLGGCMAVALFAGCGKKGGAENGKEAVSPDGEMVKSGDEIVIEFGVYETDNLTAEVWQKMIDAYEADNPGIKIKKVLEAGGSDDTTFWKTMLSSGNFPDILMQTEGLETIEGVFAEVPQELLDLYEDAALCEYNGKYITIPMVKQYRMQCYYHKDVFDELGLEEPETWDDFLNICEVIKEAGKVPMMCGGTGDVWATGEPYWICVGNGALLAEYPEFNKQLEEGTVQFNNPITIKVLTAWQEMIDKGYYYKGAMSLGYPQAAEEFQKGTAVMMMDGSWVAATMDAEGNDGIGVFAVPLMDGSKTYATNYIYWGVSETCEHKDIAFDFIQYICEENPEVYRDYLKADGLYSSTKNAVTYEQGPLMTKFMENIKDWEPETEIFYAVGEYAMPSGVASFVCKSFQNIFNGSDVEAEAASWDAEYQRLLEAQ